MNGYTIMDGLVSKDLAAQVRQAVVALHRKGRLEEPLKAAALCGLPPDTCYPDRVVRSDQVMWLTTVSLSGACSPALPPRTRAPARSSHRAREHSPDAPCRAQGRPPADSWPLSAVLVVLQEVYEDLAQFVRVRRCASHARHRLRRPPAEADSCTNGRGGTASVVAAARHLHAPAGT